jgi:hypothetical protein
MELNDFRNERFTLELDGIILNVQEYTIAETQVFRITFSDRRPALNITRANTRIGNTWVSVPQGRQKEAELIGSLIVEFFKNKK